MLKLRLLTGPRAGRQLRVSDTKPISVGRRKGRLRLHDSRVSKNHAEIFFENDLWLLRDLGSANGTYVNRKKAEGLVELEPGDMVQMGRVLMKITRCDGIGMDTQPALTDELFDDDAMGIGAATVEPGVGDDDFDLDAMFGDDDDDEPGDGLDALPSAEEPDEIEAPAASDEPEDDPEEVDEPDDTADDEVPEPMSVAFEVPADDDDSFFSDLGEATDTSDGVDLAVQEELSQDEPPAEPAEPDDPRDPFLGESEEASNDSDTSDQISLDDESGMGPRSAGTTLLTSVPHDDLTIEDDDSFFDEADASAKQEGVEEAQPVEEDDEAPAVVGLHLDHAPPQQPEPKAEEEPEPEVEVDIAAEIDVDAEIEPTEVASAAGADVELEDDESLVPASLDEQADAPADEIEDHGDLLEAEPEPQPLATSDAVVDEAPSETTPQEPVESLPPGISGQPVAEDDDEFEEAADELEAELDDLIEPEPVPEPEPEPVADISGFDEADEVDGIDELKPVVEQDEPEDAPNFDIDAAFDALSSGLDDSQELPAIGEGSAADLEPIGNGNVPPVGDAPGESAGSADAGHPDTTDALIGSQLDVDFINDALSKLEEGEATEDEPLADDTRPQASAAPATPPPTMPPAAPPAKPYLQSPPPGLNPTSMNPSTEPRSYPPHSGGSGTGRWLMSILLLLSVGGVGGWLISQNYDRFITGRDDAGSASPADASIAMTPTGQGAEQPQPEPTDGDATDPVPVLVVGNEPEDETPTQPNGPDPFAAGPGVLGPEVLDGLTGGADPDRPLDPAQPPTATNPSGPGIIVPPSIGPGTTNPTNNPTAENPQANLPGTDAPAPVADTPPARIVFLVDASGSLVDSLPQMVVWLNEALQTIESDERFAVYFFKSDEPIAIKPAGMLTPSRELLNQLGKDWLDPDAVPVFPSGRSNPAKAITQAMTHNPTDLYLLSDNAFAIYEGGATSAEALDLVNQAIGDDDVRVHGVQFFYRGDDSVLETLANQTKGTFEFVRERVVPDAEPIDLLEELEDK